MDAPLRLAVVGAAGRVGRQIRPVLRRHGIAARLIDRVAIDDASAGEEHINADFCSASNLADTLSGCDAVVHLGGIADNAPWRDLLEANVLGAVRVIEAAAEAGIGNVVHASTLHVVGLLPADHVFRGDEREAPDSPYGVSKAAAELAARLLAEQHALCITAIRIGTVNPQPRDRRQLRTWIHPEDLVALTTLAARRRDPGFMTVYGVSANGAQWRDCRAAALGYAPKHSAQSFASLFQGEALGDPDSPEHALIGGRFAAATLSASPDATLRRK